MVIKLNNLEVKKGSFKLGAINYTFDNGYVYAITGNSGSGKTLLLQSILGSIDIKKEMVLYNDLNFYENEIEIKSKYSYVADNPLFSDKLSVETIISKISKLDSRFNKQKCYEYLKKYNIYKHKKIYELSQGERKILLFGIGIFTDSQALVLDNPLAGVGLIAKREMLSLIREYMEENKITIIVTEDPSVIQNLADYILVLKDGQIVIDEDVVELQDRYRNKNIEEILISILKGVVENE
ncbi:Energy-coupling factor transporter ATP-binding protein EcfA2 [Gemella morbillorum]|uniref:ATP-binding cassette domain-containing protein n=1 Tax=Gemella morbillorum TaxID=29391 RepID=A0A2X4NBZ5_9BACL|nr:ATP-binding cassette domain-containing protein [Gemella morbillorum]EFV35942.1 ABC transporter [Gemella morbillorum M424]MDK8239276.1 ATP-binding cassette domain-containing protein [Gemella morbillorum]QGS09601.1 ATP-binding cassette domain-containing protein [Gemella morbillorum]UBH81473.1 ATP-binding cassette domain-containing protein [Gemella morbillorum]SQH55243.1 Energy-coupling factor transporter ATP-binding protein EcfA2 [Gemella morbillorum]